MPTHEFKSVEQAVEFLGGVVSDLQSQLANSKEVATCLAAVVDRLDGNSSTSLKMALGLAAQNGNQFAQDLLDGLDGKSAPKDQKLSASHLRVVKDESE